MTAIMMPTNSTWNSSTQPCHATGRSCRKSTLQKVTKRIRNMNSGRMVAKNGSIAVAASSSWGVKANTR